MLPVCKVKTIPMSSELCINSAFNGESLLLQGTHYDSCSIEVKGKQTGSSDIRPCEILAD